MKAPAKVASPGFQFLSRDAAVLEEAQQLFAGWKEPFAIHAEFRSFAGRETYFKAEPLRPWTRLRHGARQLFLRRPYPRLAEFQNLEWLGERGFFVPRPLLAGVRSAWDGVHWQFLVTERLGGLQPLSFDASEPTDEILEQLACEVARMHALGFVHRDLHLRNLAWRRAAGELRVAFFDAWRGGARWQSRPVAYDLGCLLNGLASAGGEAPAQAWLELYLKQRFPRPGAARDSLARRAYRARLNLVRY